MKAKTDKNFVEYILIGNDIQSWRPFAHSDRAKLLEKLGFQADTKEIVSDILGELLKEEKSKEVLNFLPSASCYFDRKLSHSIDGIKMYYLLNEKRSEATPYFGIAFYRKGKKPTRRSLLTQLRDKWPYSSSVTKNLNTPYLANILFQNLIIKKTQRTFVRALETMLR